MDLKKNDLFELLIEDMSDSGEGIGKTEGFIWFVKDAIIGDRVEVKAMKTKRNYGFARLMRVIEPSKARVAERCPVARQCGGCQLQMMGYEQQLKFKERKIFQNLRRIGGLSNLCLPEGNGGENDENVINEGQGVDKGEVVDGRECVDGGECVDEGEVVDGGEVAENRTGPGCRLVMEPIIGMENPWRYRNKAQFPFGRNKDGRIIAGFYAGRTHSIIECGDCLLGVPENQKILEIIKHYMELNHIDPYNEERHSGLVRHALIRKGFATGELMVCLVINGEKLPHSQSLVDALLEVPGMTSISYNVNLGRTNVIMGSRVVDLYGAGTITDFIGQIKYRISPLSFYQVNPMQTVRLYETALEYAGLTGGEVVWDLYCGIGTISLFLSQKAKRVYGVEIVPQAIDDARENARLNGIKNVEFFVGRAEDVLPEQYEKRNAHADVIVVDPPRKGCDSICLDTMVKMAPGRIVYVSCDSATLARDLKYLGERGYEVRRVRGCDMFGQGGHVETAVLLVRKP